MEEKENVALDTVPKIFWNAVNTRKNKTAMREKDLGIWQSISWREYGCLLYTSPSPRDPE